MKSEAGKKNFQLLLRRAQRRMIFAFFFELELRPICYILTCCPRREKSADRIEGETLLFGR